MRILVAEDEPDAARMLAKGLREQAFAVDVVADGEAALHEAGTTDYDALILDIMLPSMTGLAVCRALRESGVVTPILMLTARDGIDSRVEGLDSGADDYLVKPFAFAELLARLRAIIRRGVRPLLAERIELGPLTRDCRGRTASLDGRDVALTEREYTLLEYLARHAGDVLGRAAIAEHVWDASYDPLSNVIDVYIQRLRRKLGAVGAALIETRRGEGYRLLKPRNATE